MRTGILGALQAPPTSQASILGELEPASQLTQDGFGDMGGMGMVGSGPTGSQGTIGLGALGTLGHGAGAADDKSAPRGSRPAGTLEIVPGIPVLHGALDPEVVRRVVHYQLGAIFSCASSSLTAPLASPVGLLVAFSIGPDGQVTAATVTGSGYPALDTCTRLIFERLTFPKPSDGHPVEVSAYPFTLRAAE